MAYNKQYFKHINVLLFNLKSDRPFYFFKRKSKFDFNKSRKDKALSDVTYLTQDHNLVHDLTKKEDCPL